MWCVKEEPVFAGVATDRTLGGRKLTSKAYIKTTEECHWDLALRERQGDVTVPGPFHSTSRSEAFGLFRMRTRPGSIS
jgi:hypothetical protein